LGTNLKSKWSTVTFGSELFAITASTSEEAVASSSAEKSQKNDKVYIIGHTRSSIFFCTFRSRLVSYSRSSRRYTKPRIPYLRRVSSCTMADTAKLDQFGLNIFYNNIPILDNASGWFKWNQEVNELI
jgi:hypothetical protein